MRNRTPILLVSLAVAALGPSGASAEPTALKPPYGTYTVRLALPDPTVPAGRWTLVLKPGAYLLLVDADPIRNGGLLRVAGSTLTFSREILCPQAVGRYRWRLTGRVLRLSLLGRDSCAGNDRLLVLTSKPWTKKR
jgi:hypothetical protein